MTHDIGEAQVSFWAGANDSAPVAGIYSYSYGRHEGRSAVPRLTPIDTTQVTFVLGDGKSVAVTIEGDQLRVRTDGGRTRIFPSVSNVVFIDVDPS